MNSYAIDFQLLLPRPLALRLDILPFLLIYALLLALLYHHFDDPDLNLYLRLSIIAAAFIHCTAP